MARPFFGSGYFLPPSAPPGAYLALVAAFGGEAAADLYIADLVGWATGTEAQDLLDAAQGVGAPATAIAVLRLAPVSLTTNFGPEISPPLYDHPVEVVGVIAPGAPSLATF